MIWSEKVKLKSGIFEMRVFLPYAKRFDQILPNSDTEINFTKSRRYETIYSRRFFIAK